MNRAGDIPDKFGIRQLLSPSSPRPCAPGTRRMVPLRYGLVADHDFDGDIAAICSTVTTSGNADTGNLSKDISRPSS